MDINSEEYQSSADEFLDLYKKLEQLLAAKYASSKRRFSSPVVQFTAEEEGREWREELNLCRDIRNLLSHHADFEGESVVEPAQSIITMLREILNEVEHPLTAKTVMTPFNDMLVATYGDCIDAMLSRMDDSGYSHVPVIEGNGVMYGVFSVSTVFTYLRGGGENVTPRSKISDFKDFLPIDRHSTETFAFMPENATYADLRKRFGNRPPKSKRLAVIYITAHGKRDEPLKGMITPWDALRYK